MNCPLCQSQAFSLFDRDKKRSFYKCHDCTLVFVPREQILKSEEEFNRYLAHQNDENDPYYRKYLSDVLNPTLRLLHQGDVGLDFGCGKTKLLSTLYQDSGYLVDSYDVYFHPDEMIWKKEYDFIILSEVIEHLSDPLETMNQLNQILKPSGKIFIKTKFYPDSPQDFSNWFYKRDMTHVEFFNRTSMEILAHKLGRSFQEIGEDLYCLT